MKSCKYFLIFSYFLVLTQSSTIAMEVLGGLTEEQKSFLTEKKHLACPFNPNLITSIVVGCNKIDHKKHSNYDPRDTSVLFIEFGVDRDANLQFMQFEQLRERLYECSISLPHLAGIKVEFFHPRTFQDLVLTARSASELFASSEFAGPKYFQLEVLDNNLRVNKGDLTHILEGQIKPHVDDAIYQDLLSRVADKSYIDGRQAIEEILEALKFKNCIIYDESLLSRPNRRDVGMITCSF